MDPILDDLNPSQRQAVDYGEGPLMVLAGAGSGKTRVITRRIARLLRDGIPSHAVLALTFTNKAAGEMARRVEELGGDRVRVATFHSACARFLRNDGEHLGLPRDYSIFDTYDRDSCVKMLMQEFGVPLTPIKPAHIGREISRLKNFQISPAEYAEKFDFPQSPSLESLTAQLYGPYQQRLQRLGALDFDDLLGRFRELLLEHEDVAARYRDRFRWILVDEFQDTNKTQYDIARLLCGERGNVCVVGDPDQSIYRFRGAEIRNILEFQEDFADTKIIRLETNYRSTRFILDAAQSVIVHNKQRLERDLSAANDGGEPLTYRRYGSPFEENDAVAASINGLLACGTSPAEIAVFYRSHFLSRGIEEVLRRTGVPYEVVGGVSFFERREIKDLLAYLRLVVNPLDDVSMLRIINVPARGIGKVTLQKLRGLAANNGISLFEAVMEPEVRTHMRPAVASKLAELAQVFESLRRSAESSAAEPLRQLLQRIDYVQYACQLGDPQDVAREENINELVADASNYDDRHQGGLAGYLAHVSLLTSEDRRQDIGPAVSLMTIHAAKGLEFDHVFVIGMEEGILPSSRCEFDEDYEEERRLMYVAMTRARWMLHLSCSETRMVQGQEADQVPSRFVGEIADDCVDVELRQQRHVWHDWEPDGDCDPGQDEFVGLQPDALVRHEVYGAGVIVRMSGQGIQARAVVRFDDGDERELLLEYARLQVVSGEDRW